jgi:spore germination cell wall hydrolase CwlJ-like protein
MIKKSLLIGIATSTSDWITDRETMLNIGKHRFAK